MKKISLLFLFSCFSFPAASLAQPMTLEEAVAELRRQAAEMKLLKEKIERLENSSPPSVIAAESVNREVPQLEIAARATFLKPVLDGFDVFGGYVSGENGAQTVEDVNFKSLEFDFNTGYEITSTYSFSNSRWALDFEYASLDAEVSDQFTTTAMGGGRINTLENEEYQDSGVKDVFGESRLSLEGFKLGSSYNIPVNENIDLLLTMGLQKSAINAYIKSEDSEDSPNEYSTVDSKFDGLGAFVAPEAQLKLLENLNLKVGGDAGFLIGKSTAIIKDYDTDGGNSINLPIEQKDSDSRIVPTLGLDIAVEYVAYSTDSFSLLIDGGYEMEAYLGGLNDSFAGVYDAEDGIKTGSSSNLYLAGWKAGLGFRYQF